MKNFFKIYEWSCNTKKYLSYTFFTFTLASIALIAFYYSVTGCSPNTSGTNSSGFTPNKDAYLISKSSTIVPEYSTYLLAKELGKTPESRLIFVGGTLPSGYILADYQYVWWSGAAGETGTKSEIMNTSDYYFNQSSGVYTVPLTFNPSTTFESGTSLTYTLNIGNGSNAVKSSNTFTVNIITERKYSINYSYQYGLDLLVNNSGDSYDCANKTNKAFSDANTTISFETEKQSLPLKTIDYYDPYDITIDAKGLWNYIYTNLSMPDYPSLKKNRLIIVKDMSLIAPAITQTWLGFTARWLDAQGKVYGCSFVLCDRIDNGSFSTDQKKKLKTMCVIHELGHLRGQDLEITNSNHDSGHNGINKDKCVMFNADGNNLNDKLNALSFCEGHRQFLLNRQ
jgi:hypothetical protein